MHIIYFTLSYWLTICFMIMQFLILLILYYIHVDHKFFYFSMSSLCIHHINKPFTMLSGSRTCTVPDQSLTIRNISLLYCTHPQTLTSSPMCKERNSPQLWDRWLKSLTPTETVQKTISVTVMQWLPMNIATSSFLSNIVL